MADETSNHSVEANRHPLAPPDAGRQSGSPCSARASFPAAVAHLGRSVRYIPRHPPVRTPGWPEGPRHASPGQASPQASVALGQPPQETPEPCRGETRSRGRTARRRSPGLFRPVGALADVNGRFTQGGAPRRLGACPGLSSCAPLGLGAPNQAVEATATRALGLRAGTGDLRGVCGRRASPGRSP